MREVNYGWAVRYVHSSSASFFFSLSYIHIVRGIYYGTYQKPNQNTFYSGIFLFFLLLIAAFIGYVLPFTNLSFWASIVITNTIKTVLPFLSLWFIQLLWGGFYVINPTLLRFFSLHFLLPFQISVLAFLHLLFLHSAFGSSNPLAKSEKELVLFHP